MAAPAVASQPVLVELAGGEFLMGSDGHRPDERPAHAVRLRPFRAAERPVTNREYRLFVEATTAAAPRFWDEPDFSAPEQPVVGVSWLDAIAYAEWLSREIEIALRLPSEAEREFAARGGREGASWPWGDADPAALEALAAVAAIRAPHEPRDACRNAYGLYCLAENVHEWCADWYDRGYYARARADDPKGPPNGERRASRGGSWRHRVAFTRVSARSSLDPSFRYNDYGFRLFADA